MKFYGGARAAIRKVGSQEHILVKRVMRWVVDLIFSGEQHMADLNKRFLAAHYASQGGFHRDLASFLNKLGVIARYE